MFSFLLIIDSLEVITAADEDVDDISIYTSDWNTNSSDWLEQMASVFFAPIALLTISCYSEMLHMGKVWGNISPFFHFWNPLNGIFMFCFCLNLHTFYGKSCCVCFCFFGGRGKLFSSAQSGRP